MTPQDQIESLDDLARLAAAHSVAAHFADGLWHVRISGGTCARFAVYVDASLETAQRHCLHQIVAMEPMGPIANAPAEQGKGKR